MLYSVNIDQKMVAKLKKSAYQMSATYDERITQSDLVEIAFEELLKIQPEQIKTMLDNRKLQEIK